MYPLYAEKLVFNDFEVIKKISLEKQRILRKMIALFMKCSCLNTVEKEHAMYKTIILSDKVSERICNDISKLIYLLRKKIMNESQIYGCKICLFKE